MQVAKNTSLCVLYRGEVPGFGGARTIKMQTYARSIILLGLKDVKK